MPSGRRDYTVKKLLTACVIVLGVIMVYGFIRGDGRDRMRLTTIKEHRGITLVVSMPDATSRYEVLHVEACSAEISEQGIFCLPEGWSSRSDRSISRPVEPIPFRDVPRGTVQFLAYAVDRDLKVLASGQLTVMRGF